MPVSTGLDKQTTISLGLVAAILGAQAWVILTIADVKTNVAVIQEAQKRFATRSDVQLAIMEVSNGQQEQIRSLQSRVQVLEGMLFKGETPR